MFMKGVSQARAAPVSTGRGVSPTCSVGLLPAFVLFFVLALDIMFLMLLLRTALLLPLCFIFIWSVEDHYVQYINNTNYE